MEFLLDYNISLDEIEYITTNNYKEVVSVFVNNKDNVCLVLDYLINIGIKPLVELLTDRMDFFMRPLEGIKQSFDKYNVDSLVSIINDDIANLILLDN